MRFVLLIVAMLALAGCMAKRPSDLPPSPTGTTSAPPDEEDTAVPTPPQPKAGYEIGEAS